MLVATQGHRSFSDGVPCSNLRRSRNGALLFSLLLALIALLVAAPVTFGQAATSSTVRGVVKDQNGAIVPGATVTLTSKVRGDSRNAKTTGEGAYVFTAIDAGEYSLKVESAGFRTYELASLTVAPTETRSLDVTLTPGAPSETVTVTTDVAPIKTETGERSETITAKQIDNLSIISRSSLELLRILPGVAAPDPNNPNTSLDQLSFSGGANANANFNVNGIRGVDNQVSIDGSRVIDIGSNNGSIITPNNDMVSEVTIQSSNYAAEYGSSGVQITATTKSGSKDFHGEAYDYLRPPGIQANDRSNTIAGTARPQSKFQYPGGQIGGPIILPGIHINRNRDKLFFFVAFELQRQTVDPGTRFGVVPTVAERNGDFSSSLTPNGTNGRDAAGNPVLCVPGTFQFNFNPCTAVPNGNLAPYADPIGKALLSLYPLPNFNGTGSLAQYNYASSVLAPTNRTDLKMRFDYKISDKTTAYLRLAREAESNDSPYGIWWGPSAFELPSHVLGTNLGRSAALNVTSVLSPTMTNEIVFSASKLQLDYNYADPSKVSLAALGIQNLQRPFPTKSPYAPLSFISWDVNTQLWEAGQSLPLFAFNNSVSLTDTLSKVYKNHTFKFGALIERAGKTQNINGGNEGPEGQFEFEGGSDQAVSVGAVGISSSTGFLRTGAFANLFVGQLDSFAQSTDVPTGHFHLWNFEGFAQDSWKIRPNFTLEYGLRLSFYPNNVESTGLPVAFSPSAYVRGAGPFIGGNLQNPNGYLLASRGQLSNGVFPSNPAPQFAPRLGFAWDIFGNASTVIRGGAGLFYNRYQGNYLYGILTSPPNTTQATFSTWNGAINNDLTIGQLGSLSSQVLSAIGTTSVSSLDLNDNKVPRAATVSLSVAKRLPFKNVLEVAYVGTFGRHLPQTVPENFIPPTLSGTLGNANLSDPLQRAAVIGSNANGNIFQRLMPYPDYGGVTFAEFIGTSNYHSLQVTLNRQLGKNFQYFVAYTFSKALGTSSSAEVGGDQVDPLDVRGHNYGVLGFDRTHILNISYNYNFPNGAIGALKHNKIARGLFNGWQMSGITTFQSGTPIRLNFTGAITSTTALFSYFGNTASVGNGSGAVTGGITPVLLRNPVTGNTNLNGSYLDLSAIGIPGFGTSGAYEQPFTIRGPFTNNFDVTLFKNFNITETKKLQFRLGLFDLFNEAFPIPSLGDINTTLNTINTPQGGGNNSCFPLPGGTPNGVGVEPANIPGVSASNVCDPTKGYVFDQSTLANFGKVVQKHGHRRIELALKFYF